MSNWYLQRFRSMGPAEIVFRFKGELKKIYEKRFLSGQPPQSPALMENPKPIFKDSALKLAGKAIKQIPLLDFKLDTTKKINYHQDPVTGHSYERKFYGNIDIRFDTRKSAKRVWEINRLQFLPYMALHVKTRRDLKRIFDIIRSWQEDNPYLIGVNWYSAMEASLRLISFFFTWEILDINKLSSKNKEIREFRDRVWLPLIYQHMRYLSSHFSKYSSANNHIIAESAGLYISSVFWRFPESEKWQRRSRDILEREIVKQHSPNGVNREEASGYIQFVLDALAAAKIAEKNSNIKFSSRFNSMLKKIFRFSHDSTDVRGNLIEYGDSDDGRLTPPGFLSQKEEKKSHSSSFYTKEGHFFLKKRAGNSEIFMHFNAAPLGYLSTAAHGHADALSFSLNVDGKQYFVDPGTYIYHGEPKWREYFVGTLAHNTVRIDKADQAHFIGPTLWGKKYKGKVVAASSNSARDLIRATHNGYQKISHFRKVLFDKKSDRITITDEFLPRKKGGHVFEFCLHLHPEAQIIREGKHTFFIQRQGSRKVALYLDRRFDFQLISGDKSRPLGWYSPQLYIKVPATTIYMKNFAKEKFTINTIIEIL